MTDVEEINGHQSLCIFCIQSAKYVCPRCGINYCSLNCYRDKRHNTCTESFYKDCCVNFMRDMRAPNTDRKKMVGILERESSAFNNCENQFNDSRTSSEDDVEDACLESRFSSINFNDENLDLNEIWSRLTDKEKREFYRLIDTKTVSKYIPLWDPWWNEKQKPIIELDNGKIDEEKVQITPSVASLTCILKSADLPHESVGFVLLDVLFGYISINRLYNGDCKELIDEAGSLFCNIVRSFNCTENKKSPLNRCEGRTKILNISKQKSTIIYKNVSEVLASIHYQLLDADMSTSFSFKIVLIEDAIKILNSVEYCSRALHDSHQILIHLKETATKNDSIINRKTRSKLNVALQKLIFLRACLNQSDSKAVLWYSEILPKLSSALSIELFRHVSSSDNVVNNQRAAGPNWINMLRHSSTNGT